MLMNSDFLEGLVIHATDGEVGKVDQFLFDDERWIIRYFTVQTGGWLGGRQVLISPMSVARADWDGKLLDVTLTKQQVENSPDIDTKLPVSRQHEAAFLGYYGYPFYWSGSSLSDGSMYPVGIPVAAPDQAALAGQESPGDSHLRSSGTVTGYDIEATDGDIGHLDGFVIDDEGWLIRYIEIATRNWLPGKKVLLSPGWVTGVSWDDSKVYAGVTMEAIRNAPDYIVSERLTREYEARLYSHYSRPPYWQAGAISTYGLRTKADWKRVRYSHAE